MKLPNFPVSAACGAPEFVGREEKRLMPSRHKFDELVQRDEGEVRLAEAALLFAIDHCRGLKIAPWLIPTSRAITVVETPPRAPTNQSPVAAKWRSFPTKNGPDA